MADGTTHSVLMTTTATAAEAEVLADALVEGRLAACVQLMPIVSHYRWEGETARAEETLVLVKTTAARAPDVREFVDHHHPYGTPELVEVPIVSGLPAYLDWIDRSVAPEPGT